MIVEFSVGNFRSIRERQTLSFEATAQSDYPDNVFEVNGYRLLKGIGIYGANSSGKSNVVLALQQMKRVVEDSFKLSSEDKIDTTPFLLNTASATAPSFFELIFLVGKKCYRYGFEVDTERVHSEYLYESAKRGSTEKLLFARDGDDIDSTNFEEGLGIENKTKKNTLFLTVANQFNGKISEVVFSKIIEVSVFSGIEHTEHRHVTKIFMDMESLSPYITEFIGDLSLGFNQFKLSEDEGYNNKRILTSHHIFDNKGQVTGLQEFDSLRHESSGTNKLLDLSGWIIFSLVAGGLLAIDELDAKLHPILTQTIIKLFLNKEANPKNTQLLFTTHDTNLLSADLLRRDQIYFTEKNEREETCLYSLVEFKPRKDTSLEKNYIQGRYGAIPYLGDFSKLIQDGKSGEDK